MKSNDDMMLPEYDLRGRKGVRGKFHNAYSKGHTVRVTDGKKLVSDKYFAAIESDVREYYPDSKAINRALRKLIALVPHKS